jgi:hypothetical protein
MAGERDELAEDGGSVYAAVWEEWDARRGAFARFALDRREESAAAEVESARLAQMSADAQEER